MKSSIVLSASIVAVVFVGATRSAQAGAAAVASHPQVSMLADKAPEKVVINDQKDKEPKDKDDRSQTKPPKDSTSDHDRGQGNDDKAQHDNGKGNDDKPGR
jgi:hypothetical protein